MPILVVTRRLFPLSLANALALAVALFPASALAIGPADFTCLSPSGKKAVVLNTPTLNDAARADIKVGIPFIFVNPALFRVAFGEQGTEAVFLFVLEHECGHFQEGEARQRENIPNSLASEEAADAWAMKELYRLGFTDAQFEEVFAAFAPLPAFDDLHLPGAQRVAILRAMLEYLKKNP